MYCARFATGDLQVGIFYNVLHFNNIFSNNSRILFCLYVRTHKNTERYPSPSPSLANLRWYLLRIENTLWGTQLHPLGVRVPDLLKCFAMWWSSHPSDLSRRVVAINDSWYWWAIYDHSMLKRLHLRDQWQGQEARLLKHQASCVEALGACWCVDWGWSSY